ACAADDMLRRVSLTEPSGYLLRPFDPSQLRTAIELALHKHAAERRLRESERRYAITLASLGDAVIACDERSQVTFMNPVASALTGWPAEEAQGRPLAEGFRTVGDDGRTGLVARDGRAVPIEDRASPVAVASRAWCSCSAT